MTPASFFECLSLSAWIKSLGLSIFEILVFNSSIDTFFFASAISKAFVAKILFKMLLIRCLNQLVKFI